ncbi:MAG: SDR family NAD(P)-dependent oxidoreductase [Methylobacter sp.]
MSLLVPSLLAPSMESSISIPKPVIELLLSEPNISDCAVLVRQDDKSVDEMIIYFIPQGPVNQTQLLTRLKALLRKSGQIIRFVPLFKLPLASDGSLDYQALAAIPVLDDDFLDRSEQKLRMQTGIKNVAIVRVQREHSEESRYHLNDLLPCEPAQNKHTELPAPPLQEAMTSDGTLQPAIVNGGDLEDSEMINKSTLLDLLRLAAEKCGNRAIRFIMEDGNMTEWSYAELWERAGRVYGGLLATGLKAGDKVIFQMRSNPDILSTFWACQMGGFIPVIVEVPTIYQSGNQALERVIGLLQLLKNPLMIADESAASAFAKVDIALFAQLPRICSIEQLRSAAPEHNLHNAQPDDIALFNLSSGSTGIPKCIMLTHRNLLSRAYGTNQLCGYSSADIILNWLPFDHIGSISDWHIRCVLLGCELIYVDKDYILANPVNWLNLIDRFRVSNSWAPNFAFALINKQLELLQSPEWDLSCVKGLLTAGEAVSDNSVQGFIRALGKFGLRRTAVLPAFGMAELGSGVTYFVPSDINPLRFHTVRKSSMGSTIERVGEDHPDATHFADLGPAIPGVSLRIADNDGNVLPLETVGRLQIKGDVVFQGYFDNPAANAASFQADGWFNTGDLGFLSQDNLVLTGREKETIIIKGANYYSHEIEDTATQVEGVEPSFTAACGVRRAGDREEKLAIFFVPHLADAEAELIRAIRTQVANRYGISPTYLIPLEKHQIAKTAIGKIQRTQLKQRLEAGEFDTIIKRVDLILGNANTLPSWFYQSTWTPKQALFLEHHLINGAVMVLMDDSGLGGALPKQLQALRQRCVTVAPGSGFKHKDGFHYEIDFRSKADFLELFLRLAEKRISISHIVSLIDYQAESGPDAAQQTKGEHPLNVAAFLHMIQAAVETDSIDPLQRIMWVASDCHTVTHDDLGAANKAMMTGFTNALRMEYPTIECVHIDLPFANHTNNAKLIVQELGAFSKEPLVAYRKGQRYVSRLEQLDIVNARLTPFKLKTGGHYLVSGGLGGLGFELCRRLGRDYDAKLLIIGRSPLGEEDTQQRQRYQALLDNNKDCIYVQADISDQEVVHHQVQMAEAAWGRPLDGIFHLAGMAHERSLDSESIESFADMARPKCEGIVVLGELLKARKETFLMAFSSLNATFGGSNISSISAANAYLDAYCRKLYRSGLPALCYGWSLWDGMGMSANSATKSIAAAKGFYPISFEEGFNSLRALLQAGQPEALIGLDAGKNAIRVLIADSHYEQQSVVGFLEVDGSLSKESLPHTIAFHDRFGSSLDCRLEAIASLPLTEDGAVDKNQLIVLASHDHQTKKKPTNAVEATLVELWHELLQVNDIGTQDNFFELGGDSLLTVQLVALIEKHFKQQVPASTIFYAPTVERLAEILREEKQAPDLFSLVPIKAEGSKPPLFIIQSDSWELVRYLDPELPVYGLNYGVGAKTEESKLNLPERLEDVAAHFVTEIRSVQPSGPYFMIGHSNAGILAYEMAQQLAAQGQTLGLLGLIDTWYLPDMLNVPFLSKRDRLQMLSKLSLKEKSAVFWNWVGTYFQQLQRRLFTKKSDLPFLERAMHLYENYVPTSYSGKISYFKCVKQAGLQPVGNDERKWEELASEGIQVHPIACHHYDVLLDPHVKMLADQISRYL